MYGSQVNLAVDTFAGEAGASGQINADFLGPLFLSKRWYPLYITDLSVKKSAEICLAAEATLRSDLRSFHPPSSKIKSFKVLYLHFVMMD